MKRDYGGGTREEGWSLGSGEKPPSSDKKISKRHVAVGASVCLLVAGAVFGYAALPGSPPIATTPAESLEVNAASAFVIPNEEDEEDSAATYIPPFYEFDTNKDGKINLDEYLGHMTRLRDDALGRLNASSLPSVAKGFISDRLRKNYVKESGCVTRMINRVS